MRQKSSYITFYTFPPCNYSWENVSEVRISWYIHVFQKDIHVLFDNIKTQIMLVFGYFKRLGEKWDVCQSDWWIDTIGDAFWRCAKHFKVSKPQKQLVLFDNIYGQHSEKRPCKPRLWVKFLFILAKYDDLIQMDNIAHHGHSKYCHIMIFLMFYICVIKQDKGGYVMVL